jgi:hypothetical protein
MLSLPEDIAAACQPLFEILPLEQAMPHLLGSHPKHTELVEEIVRKPAVAALPALVAGLWLYVDNLDRSHTVSQSIETTTGSYWHGIMHRREGDFSNSRYWHRKAAGHPLLAAQPDGLVGEVEWTRGQDVPEVVAKQRAEWATLFQWCATQKA